MKRYALSNAIGGQLSVSLLRAKDISNSFQHYCVKGIIHLKIKGELYPLLDANNRYIECKENK